MAWGSRSSRAARLLPALWLLLGVPLLSAGADAKVYFSKNEALELAFPDADRVDRQSLVLDEAQVDAVQNRAKSELGSRIITLYTGWKGGQVQGYAFIDVHTVRTLPEAFLVVITPEGEIRSLRVLAFYEPPDYLPSDRWLRQFENRSLEPALRIGGHIHGIAGSTLSSHAVTGGVRRSLALFHELVGVDGRGIAGPHHAAPGPVADTDPISPGVAAGAVARPGEATAPTGGGQ